MIITNGIYGMRVLVVLCFCATIAACNEEDNIVEPSIEEVSEYEKIDVVTGLELRDENGSPIGRWGSPNESREEMDLWPNPMLGVFSVQGLQSIEKMYIIPSSCKADSTDNLVELSNDLSFSQIEIEAASTAEIEFDLGSTLIYSVNMEDYYEGFYKLFFKLVDGRYARINTYKGSQASPNVFEELDALCPR